jgi:hypothetical protein
MASARERREARALEIIKAIGRPKRKRAPRVAPNRGKGVAVEWIRQHVTYEADTCLIFPFYRSPDGYGRVGFLNKSYYPHQLMCQFAHGPKPGDGYEVAHSCGNGVGGCTNPRHLSWKTKSDNRRDSNLHGTGVRSLRGNKGKLTPDQVIQIRGLKGRKSQHAIAVMFGISPPSVRAIFTGKMYASV